MKMGEERSQAQYLCGMAAENRAQTCPRFAHDLEAPKLQPPMSATLESCCNIVISLFRSLLRW